MPYLSSALLMINFQHTNRDETLKALESLHAVLQATQVIGEDLNIFHFIEIFFQALTKDASTTFLHVKNLIGRHGLLSFF